MTRGATVGSSNIEALEKNKQGAKSRNQFKQWKNPVIKKVNNDQFNHIEYDQLEFLFDKILHVLTNLSWLQCHHWPIPERPTSPILPLLQYCFYH